MSLQTNSIRSGSLMTKQRLKPTCNPYSPPPRLHQQDSFTQRRTLPLSSLPTPDGTPNNHRPLEDDTDNRPAAIPPPGFSHLPTPPFFDHLRRTLYETYSSSTVSTPPKPTCTSSHYANNQPGPPHEIHISRPRMTRTRSTEMSCGTRCGAIRTHIPQLAQETREKLSMPLAK